MARHVGREFEVGAVEPGELREFVHRQHAVDQKHLVVGRRKRLLHEGAQLLRHLGVHLEADHRTPPAPLQRGLEHANQIFRLFLDFEFGVADDAERALALDRVAGKQPADEQAGGLFQRDQAHRAVLVAGMRMKRSILPGMRISAFIGLPSDTRAQLQRDGEAEARDERERMRRIDRKRRQQREDVVEEMILDPGPLRLGEVVAVDQHDAGLATGWCADRARSPAGRRQVRKRSC